MYNVEIIEVSEFAQNCRVLWEPTTKEALVIDPGSQASKIWQFVEENKLRVTQIWLTHSHLDHCGGVTSLIKYTQAKLFAHPIEKMFRARVEEIAARYGVPPGGDDGMRNCPEPDTYVSGGEVLDFASYKFEVLFTPGHSPGHVCFLDRNRGYLIAGDTVFQGSIGRTDLPGGDGPLLLKSIQQNIMSLPGSTIIAPGHGPDTSVEEEKRSNPYLQSR